MSEEQGTTSAQKTEQKTQKLEIKPTQVAAGALASITAAVLGSKLGVAGTVAGAGLASVVGTVGASVYQHSIERTRAHVRARVGQQAQDCPDEEPTVLLSHDAETVRLTVAPPSDEPAAKRRWPMVVLTAAVAFVLGIAVLTGIELIKGGSISGGDSRTTLGSVFGQHGGNPPTHPSQTTSQTPTSTTSPTTTSSTPPPSSTTPTTTTSPTTTTTTTTPPTSTTTVNGTSTSPSTPPRAN